MKSFFHGAIQVLETPQGLVPLRFSPEQMAYFAPLAYRFRSYNAAGIRLEFVTDSPFFRMAYEAKVKPGTTEQLLFDVFVDDSLIAAPGGAVTGQDTAEWRVELPIQPGHPRRVTVYLPYLAQITVRDMGVAEGAVWQPVEPEGPALLCLGDSITQGMNASRSSSTYTALLARFLGMSLLNQGVSGYVFDAETLDPALPVRPSLITVAYGTNDWVLCDSLAQFAERAEAYLTKLEASYPGVPIAVFTPIYRTDVADPQRTGTLDDIRAAIRSSCA